MFISTLQCIENLHYSDLLNSSMSESSSVTMPQSVRWVRMSFMSESSSVTMPQSVRWVQKSPMNESSSVAMPQSVRWVRKSFEWVIFSNSDHVCQVSTDVLYEWIIFSNDVPVCQVSTGVLYEWVVFSNDVPDCQVSTDVHHEWLIFSNDAPVCQVSTEVLHEWVVFSNNAPVCQVNTNVLHESHFQLRCPSLSGEYKSPSWVSHFQFTMAQSVRWVQMSSMSESFSVNDVPVCRVSTNVLHEWVIFSLRCPNLSGEYKCPPWVSHFQFTMSQSVRWVQMSSMSESFSVMMSQSVRWVQMSSMSKPLDIVYTSIYL